MPNLDAFIARWQDSGAAERANKDTFLLELCDVLEVPRPSPTTGDSARDQYVFERDAKMPHPGGEITIGKVDLYKAGCFILEAKQGSEAGSKKLGTAKRETPAWNIAMRDAFGQALGYARSFDKPPPFLVTCDLGYCFDLYATFDGSSDYRAFPNAHSSRIFVRDLPKHRDTLRAIFTDPHAIDPSKQAAKVTREVAGYLANLAKKLEADGHAPELVATFLMRCLFTMFAEDVGLLPEESFTKAIRDFWIPSPPSFTGGIEQLWRTMNEGGHMFGVVGKILRFNGGLFANPVALPLDEHALRLLLVAAECNWADVEPAIFGTLLERALDPRERHLLGAHFTPRAYVERLVRPTIEDPLRADWDVVQAHVRQLVTGSEGKTEKIAKAAVKAAAADVRAFHEKLCKTRVLDPACGSGNFLYVTLDLFKRLEGEVFAMLESLGETQTVLHMEGIRVTPEQFHGIEIKRWAKEIAELVLWIGYLQWHFRQYGKTIPVPEPVLRDYHNIECRDAVLAYDADEMVKDETTGKPVTRWDGVTMKKSPVTGEDVPDENAQSPLYRYVNPRKAEWPEADFIVGNPPFIGKNKIRIVLGDSYVDALRTAYPEVPETVDLVMYWWSRAATVVQAGGARRFGLITTNSITQTFNRQVLEAHLLDAGTLGLVFAISDHPWVESSDGAAVRIAMTVGAAGSCEGTLLQVTQEVEMPDGESEVVTAASRGLIHPDLRIGADVSQSRALVANKGLSFQGIIPLGDGFKLTRADLGDLGLDASRLPSVVRRYVIGRDLAQRAEERWVIDFFGRTEPDALAANPGLYQRLLTLVKPERDQNRREARKKNWWVFAENAPKMRRALAGLRLMIATPETAKHRVFVLLGAEVLPDQKLRVIASADTYLLGVLSSRCHLVWASATGAMLEDRPVYNNTLCFERFPVAACTGARRDNVAALAASLDAHRKRQLVAHPDLTITGMYNVLAKLRSGEVLTAKDKAIHEQGLVSILKKLHDDLDAAVFDAYGWPHELTDEQILERLVALNKERADEERRGLVRWLRPEFQHPGEAKPAMKQEALSGTDDETEDAPVVALAATPWPKKMPEQIAAVRDLVVKTNDEHAAGDVARGFKGAKEKDVEEVLDGLAALGLLVSYELPEGKRYRSAAFVGRG